MSRRYIEKMTKHTVKKKLTTGQKHLKHSLRLLKKWTNVKPETSAKRKEHRHSLMKKINSLHHHRVYLRKKHTRSKSPRKTSTPKSRRRRHTPSTEMIVPSVPRYISPPVAPINVSPMSSELRSMVSPDSQMFESISPYEESPVVQDELPQEVLPQDELPQEGLPQEQLPSLVYDDNMSPESNGSLSLGDLQGEPDSMSANTTMDSNGSR